MTGSDDVHRTIVKCGLVKGTPTSLRFFLNIIFLLRFDSFFSFLVYLFNRLCEAKTWFFPMLSVIIKNFDGSYYWFLLLYLSWFYFCGRLVGILNWGSKPKPFRGPNHHIRAPNRPNHHIRAPNPSGARTTLFGPRTLLSLKHFLGLQKAISKNK